MKRLILSLCLAVFLASFSTLSMATIAEVSPGMAGDGETLTISSSAVGFTAGKRSVVGSEGTVKAGRVVFALEGGDVRFTIDGTTPSSTVGSLIKAGSVVEITGIVNITAFRAIRTGGTDGTAWVTYFRDKVDNGDASINNGGATPTGTVTVTGSVTVSNAAGASAVNVQDGGNSLTVDGTFWQTTQPVSAASLPLPTGAATEATLSTLNGKVTACNTGAVTLTATTNTPAHGQVSIPTTAGGTLLIAANALRRTLMIQNIGSFPMFCGNTGVSATTGWKVDIGVTRTWDVVVPTAAYYCIGSGGTTTATYDEVQ